MLPKMPFLTWFSLSNLPWSKIRSVTRIVLRLWVTRHWVKCGLKATKKTQLGELTIISGVKCGQPANMLWGCSKNCILLDCTEIQCVYFTVCVTSYGIPDTFPVENPVYFSWTHCSRRCVQLAWCSSHVVKSLRPPLKVWFGRILIA